MKEILWLCLLCAVTLGMPIQLTDATFEHDTQAVTGSTTGDWLILFCDDRFKLCKQIQHTWQELSDVLFGKINVA
jgi:hypothetical protein